MTASTNDLFDRFHVLDEGLDELIAAHAARIARLREALPRTEPAEEPAEEVNRIKEAVLCVLATDLRKPLTAVLGYAHLLNTGRLSPDRARHAAEAIERNALIVDRLVDGLAEMCRGEEGQGTNGPSRPAVAAG